MCGSTAPARQFCDPPGRSDCPIGHPPPRFCRGCQPCWVQMDRHVAGGASLMDRRAELRAALLPRLQQAWDAEGVGSYRVGDAYVQWARFEPGLQIECVSNVFLEGSAELG